MHSAAMTTPSGGPMAPARARRRGVLLAAVALVIGAAIPLSAAAQTSDDAARRAAQEIQAARDRANAAADAYFQAESDIAVLEDDLAALELEAEQLQITVDQLREDVQDVALARYVNSGASGIPLLTGLQAPQEQVQAEVFVDVLTNTGGDALDQFDLAQKDLVETEATLARQRQELEQLRVTQVQLQENALAEVERLRSVEEQRLRDEAVQRALAAQQAEERARLEELARQEAEAAAQAQPDPVVTTAAPSGESGGGPTATTPAPVPTSPPGGGSGGSSGGRTGGGGSGNSPPPPTPGPIDGIACPMPGSAYSDTYGAPRSGGRSHQGVDMLAPYGNPIYAVTSGSVSFGSNTLGGNAIWLSGNNGNRYYYAHLSRFSGSSRSVQRGELIGYNGDTGNASGVPHLHFEIHPGGGLAINPTPSVRAAGC